MLSYQHSYHAGNLADVHKHATLLALLRQCVKSSAKLTYVESHGGRGRYHLHGAEAEKTGEWRRGILPLVSTPKLEPLVNQYKKFVMDFSRASQPDALKYYPGSPAIAKGLMRRSDRGIVHDLHPQEHLALNEGLKSDFRFTVVHGDGLAGLASFAPQAAEFTFGLIDPSYETKDEFDQIADLAQTLVTRGQVHVVLVWYPRLTDQRHGALEQCLQELGAVTRFDWADFDPGTKAGAKMVGSGMGLLLADSIKPDLAKSIKRAHKLVTRGLFNWYSDAKAA